MTDRPPVPRTKHSALATVMVALAGAIVLGYSYVAYSQRELFPPDREEIPASVRASPGGYRSYHFWHSGYHGGK
jgi:hypothetical protein